MKKRKWLIKSMVLSQFLFMPMSQIYASQYSPIPAKENVVSEDNRYENALQKVLSKEQKDKEQIDEFIGQVKKAAIAASDEVLIRPSVIIAEMALNSNWGRTKETENFNYFHQEISDISDKEVLESKFKKFSSTEESIKDYYENNGGYIASTASLMEDISARQLYSSFQLYGEYLLEIIEGTELKKLDEELSTPSSNEENINQETEIENEILEDDSSKESIFSNDGESEEKQDEVVQDKTTENFDEKEDNLTEKEEINSIATFSDSKKTSKKINYTANVIKRDVPIYEINNEEFKKVDFSSNIFGNQVYGREEILKDGKLYTLLYSTSSKKIGWILKEALDIEHVLKTEKVNYSAFIVKRGFSIDSLPWGTEGYVNISSSADLINKEVRVLQEKETRRSTYVQIQLNGRIVGWIDKNSLGKNIILSEKPLQYAAIIKDRETFISSLPEGTADAKVLAQGKDYLGKKLVIIKEADTLKGKYSFITLNSTPVGWVLKDHLDIEKEVSSRLINYGAKIVTKNHSIDSLPYGLEGFERVASSKDYYGDTVVVSKEIISRRGTFLLVSRYGKDLGWIDKNALEQETILNEKTVQYAATIIGKNNTIDTWPYGLEGFTTIGRTTDSEFANKKVLVTKELVTNRGTFALVSINGKELGWIDKKALDVEKVLSTTNTSYAAKVVTKTNTIDSLPYGVEGFVKISSSAEYYNLSVLAVQEKVTQRGTFVNIVYQGKNIGWIDSRALNVETVLSTSNANYRSKVIRNGYTIDTLPYGITGFLNTSRSNNYLNQTVNVSQEKVTQRGTFALISLNGNVLGWIDKRALSNKIETRNVFIDPGHGGSEYGAVYYGVYEKDLNLKVSLLVKEKLESMGYNVIISRTTDKYIDLYDRARMANSSNADIFVSIHHNALGGTSANGIETFYYKYDSDYPSKINGVMHDDPVRISQSMVLTQNIHKMLINGTGAYDRGVKTESFAVIRETRIPATLLELGFMSNSSEINQLTNPSYQNTLANSIVKGIENYFN